jgi:uncharacterized protein (TIGR02284 family)
MAERTERTALNTLIVTCKDAARGFTWAAEHLNNVKLKALFNELATMHMQYAEELIPHAQRLGGAAEAEGSMMAALHRAWMSIKDRVSGEHNHDQTIVLEAERGQREALAVYAEALNGMLPPGIVDLIEAQHAGIKTALERLQATTAGTV